MHSFVPRFFHASPWSKPEASSSPPSDAILRRIVPSLELAIDASPVSGAEDKLPQGQQVFESVTVVKIQNLAVLTEELTSLESSGLVSIDFEVAAHPEFRGYEAAALQPATAAPRLLSIYAGGDKVIVFDLWVLGADAIPLLFGFLSRHRVVAHNATYELKMAWRLGIDLQDLHCSRIAVAILDGERGTSLAAACERRLGVPVDKTLQLADYGILNLSPKVFEYCAQDAVLCYRLFNQCAEEITRRELTTGYAIARGAMRQIAHAETRGLLVDRNALTEFGEQSIQKATNAKAALPPDMATVNLRSSKQLQTWFVKTADVATQKSWPRTPKGAFDFSRKGLGSAPSGPVRNVLLGVAEARSGMQRRGMVASREAQINPATGCVHPSYKLLGTDAGRLSANNPNVQQLPPGERVAYVARPGYAYVDADAGGLQLRIAATLGVQSMASALMLGIDLHALAGGGIDINDPDRDVKIAAVDPQARKTGKAANFSLLFGMSIATFHARLRATVDESLSADDAARVYHAWHKAWPEVRGLQDALFAEARRNGYSTTPGGRVRDYVREGIPNWYAIRNITLNASIQGSDADLIMLVAAYLDIALMQFKNASIAVLVHDEVLIECLGSDVHEVAKVLDTAWRWAWAQLFPFRLDLGSESAQFCQPTIGRSFGNV